MKKVLKKLFLLSVLSALAILFVGCADEEAKPDGSAGEIASNFRSNFVDDSYTPLATIPGDKITLDNGTLELELNASLLGAGAENLPATSYIVGLDGLFSQLTTISDSYLTLEGVRGDYKEIAAGPITKDKGAQAKLTKQGSSSDSSKTLFVALTVEELLVYSNLLNQAKLGLVSSNQLNDFLDKLRYTDSKDNETKYRVILVNFK